MLPTLFICTLIVYVCMCVHACVHVEFIGNLKARQRAESDRIMTTKSDKLRPCSHEQRFHLMESVHCGKHLCVSWMCQYLLAITVHRCVLCSSSEWLPFSSPLCVVRSLDVCLTITLIPGFCGNVGWLQTERGGRNYVVLTVRVIM